MLMISFVQDIGASLKFPLSLIRVRVMREWEWRYGSTILDLRSRWR
jgi:hypothetical protein